MRSDYSKWLFRKNPEASWGDVYRGLVATVSTNQSLTLQDFNCRPRHRIILLLHGHGGGSTRTRLKRNIPKRAVPRRHLKKKMKTALILRKTISLMMTWLKRGTLRRNKKSRPLRPQTSSRSQVLVNHTNLVTQNTPLLCLHVHVRRTHRGNGCLPRKTAYS